MKYRDEYVLFCTHIMAVSCALRKQALHEEIECNNKKGGASDPVLL